MPAADLVRWRRYVSTSENRAGRVRVSRAESSQWPAKDLRTGRGLSRIRTRACRNPKPHSDASACLVFDAESLASGPLAGAGRWPVRLHAPCNSHAHTTLARTTRRGAGISIRGVSSLSSYRTTPIFWPCAATSKAMLSVRDLSSEPRIGAGAASGARITNKPTARLA